MFREALARDWLVGARSLDRQRDRRRGRHCGSRSDREEKHIATCRDASEVSPAKIRDGQRKELIFKSPNAQYSQEKRPRARRDSSARAEFCPRCDHCLFSRAG
jgi:hypothetical protein